jgi:hypothetical protein
MSIDWPVGRGLDERSSTVREGRRWEGRRVSQYARQGPAIPAPDMRMRRGEHVGVRAIVGNVLMVHDNRY